MSLEHSVLVFILAGVALFLLDYTLKKRWDLPKSNQRTYYNAIHKYLSHSLMGISLILTLVVGFMAIEEAISIEFLILPIVISIVNEILRGYMEWKHDENRYMYKATVINLAGGLVIGILLLTSLFEDIKPFI